MEASITSVATRANIYECEFMGLLVTRPLREYNMGRENGMGKLQEGSMLLQCRELQRSLSFLEYPIPLDTGTALQLPTHVALYSNKRSLQ